MAKRRPWFWVKRYPSAAYYVFLYPANKKPGATGTSGRYCFVLLAKRFIRATGIKIKPGECLKVEFSAKVVK